MPVKQAAFKHVRQTKKKTAKNLKEKQNLRYLLKKTRSFIDKKDKAKTAEWLTKSVKALDKAVQHKLIKKNTASRHKSRLQRQLNKLK